MSRIKMWAATALAVGAVGAGALVAAPTASALPSRATCDVLEMMASNAYTLGQISFGLGLYVQATQYYKMAAIRYTQASICYRSL